MAHLILGWDEVIKYSPFNNKKKQRIPGSFFDLSDYQIARWISQKPFTPLNRPIPPMQWQKLQELKCAGL